MPTLLLKFQVNLEEHDGSAHPLHYGPLFHRWLPDGKKDAIVLNTGDPNAELRVWFERWGFKEDKDRIEFSYKRREVDPETIHKQAILEAGPLMGLLKIQALPEENLAPLQENKVGDGHYIELGKRVVRLIHRPVARFLDVLRTHYGQYWVHGLEEWDSRRRSLGSYCSFQLELEWSLDEGKTWAPFVPDKRSAHLELTIALGRSFRDYLTKDDWQALAKIGQAGDEPPLAAFLLARAHQFSDQGNLKHALVEAVSALELALQDFVRRKLGGDDSLTESVQSFWKATLPAQLISIVGALGTVSVQDMKRAAEAIRIRNAVVHDGSEPPASANDVIPGLLKAVAALVSGLPFRFPTVNPGNAIIPLEEWEKQMEKDDHGG